MTRSILLLAVTIGLAGQALAQTAAPAPAATPAPAAAEPAPDAKSPDAKSKVKEIREACRGDAKSQGLKGEDKMKAISACVVKQRPDLAMREQCRMDGWGKGLRKDELKSFVKDCVKSKA